MDDPLSSMDERLRSLDNKYQIKILQFYKTVQQICDENNKNNNFIKLAFIMTNTHFITFVITEFTSRSSQKNLFSILNK